MIVTADVLALESSGLSRFQGIMFVGWWGTAPMMEMVKKGIGSGMIWARLWIA